MATLVQKVARYAYKTFFDYSQTGLVTVVNERLPKLKELVHLCTCKDVALEECLIRNNGPFIIGLHNGAPVTYVHLWEDSVLSMGVFILKSGMRIPLHDHPKMYGIIKVLHGTMRVTSFNAASNSSDGSSALPEEITNLSSSQQKTVKSVIAVPEVYATNSSEPCVLTETEGNYHEITAIDGPVAFLDILSPPYDHDSNSRECHYYDELNVNGIQSRRNPGDQQYCRYLLPTGQPWDFWCDSAVYKGPHIYPVEEL